MVKRTSAAATPRPQHRGRNTHVSDARVPPQLALALVFNDSSQLGKRIQTPPRATETPGARPSLPVSCRFHTRLRLQAQSGSSPRMDRVSVFSSFRYDCRSLCPVLLCLANVYLPSRLDSRVSFSRNRPALPAPSRASLHPDERPVHGTLPPPLPPKGSGFTHLSLLHTGESSVR